jgi:hypothetical protein
LGRLLAAPYLATEKKTKKNHHKRKTKRKEKDEQNEPKNKAEPNFKRTQIPKPNSRFRYPSITHRMRKHEPKGGIYRRRSHERKYAYY